MLKKSAPKTIDFSSDNPKTNRYEWLIFDNVDKLDKIINIRY